MDYGFVRVAAAIPRLRVADCQYNSERIAELIKKADAEGAQLVVFPELSITAYTCGDLFQQRTLLEDSQKGLSRIIENTRHHEVVAIVGMPIYADNQLFNCGVAIQEGKILGAVPKLHIPGYMEFYEKRWFAAGSRAVSDSVVLCGQVVPFGTDLLFEAQEHNGRKLSFGIEICEDLWVPVPPSAYQAVAGAELIFNLSASDDIIGKYEYRKDLVRQQSAKCIAGYVYASSGVDESTTDLVFGGHAIIAENGIIIEESKRFLREEQLIYTDVDVERLINDRLKNTTFMDIGTVKRFRRVSFNLKTYELANIRRHIDPYPFVPSNPLTRNERCREIFSIQTTGLSKRLSYTGLKHAVIGISGGLDSTLALLATANTFDAMKMPRENIVAITMPGFGTSDETYSNAIALMESLGVDAREIDIKEACIKHFADIGHDASIHDLTYENVQARERMQVLMDLANKIEGLVVGTGDLSELALGWCTYNGDHMSMYSINCGIPKTLVKYLVNWVADNVADSGTKEVLYRILRTPITPELLPPSANGDINQKTEDIIGPYELHDFFLYHMIRYGAPPGKILFLAEHAFKGTYDAKTLKNWLKVFYKRFFSQQFKRSCMPDGPKVGTISLSPRGDWRMPSDAESEAWLKELE